MTACGPRWRSGGRAVQPVATSGRTGAGRQTPAARCPQCAPRSASTKPDCASSRPTKVRIGSHHLRNAPGLAAARPRSEGGRREPPVPPRADHQPRQERHRTPGASSRSPPPTRPATPPARRDHSAMPVAARAWRSAALPAGVRARAYPIAATNSARMTDRWRWLATRQRADPEQQAPPGPETRARPHAPPPRGVPPAVGDRLRAATARGT